MDVSRLFPSDERPPSLYQWYLRDITTEFHARIWEDTRWEKGLFHRNCSCLEEGPIRSTWPLL